MSEAPNSESLKSKLDEFHEMERLAQVALLEGKQQVSSYAIDEPPRIGEPNIHDAQHKVYRVDIKSVQKYLNDIGSIVERFLKTIPLDAGVPTPEADLRFLEICGDFSWEDHFPYSLTAGCSLNLAHSRFQSSIELRVINESSSIDLSYSRIEKSLIIRIDHGAYLDMAADRIFCAGEFAIEAYTPSKEQPSEALAISLKEAQITKEFSCCHLIITEAIFAGSSFGAKALFKETSFEQNANFINSKFKCGALFSNCSFEVAPDFHGSELHQDTVFQNCFFNTSRSQFLDVASFRVLKAHYGKMRDSKHELMFYALEQRAERKSAMNGEIVSIISWLYDEISEYGASIERTVKVFLLWNVNFFLFFYLELVVSSQQLITVKNEALNVYPALILTLQNTFNPLALFSEKQLVSVNSIALYSISLIQSLGAVTIVALMLLAIRGRFRKGGGSDN